MAKVNLFLDFREFLESLNSARARYLVLGGYAVNHYGYHRATGDLDIWIGLDASTLVAVSEVLHTFGGFPRSKVRPEILGEPEKVFVFGREPVRIDILTTPTGVEFEGCYGRRQIVVWDGLKVPLIALDDLRVNKIASGRFKDLVMSKP